MGAVLYVVRYSAVQKMLKEDVGRCPKLQKNSEYGSDLRVLFLLHLSLIFF